MFTINVRNVNEAWKVGLNHMSFLGSKEETRNGEAFVLPYPVTTTYNRPMERVLFCPIRRANPFFHLFESMWMLMGRNDAKWLDTYVGDFSARYAEDNGKMHGAYGRRWREHFDFDQLDQIISLLSEDLYSRQAVITMWDPSVDLGTVVRDKPCNTHIYLRRRPSNVYPQLDQLDMTVCCRSNDMIWGAYGSNAVHFSILLEYLCANLNVQPGQMYQISNNMHVYRHVVDQMFPVQIGLNKFRVEDCDLYRTGHVVRTPMFRSEWVWGGVRHQLWKWSDNPTADVRHYTELFAHLLVPMSRVHELAVAKKNSLALSMCDTIVHTDWRLACQQWVQRRLDRSEAKHKQEIEDDSILVTAQEELHLGRAKSDTRAEKGTVEKKRTDKEGDADTAESDAEQQTTD